MNSYNSTGWVAESRHPESLRHLLSQSRIYGDYPWDETDKPPVALWSDIESGMIDEAANRDRQREIGICHWPWVVASHIGIKWADPDQGRLGTCAGFAADTASFCMLLQHVADGVELEVVPTNPYPAWVLGREDANYRGDGATMSMVLNGVNKYGRFPTAKVGSYAESISKKINWRALASDAEYFQAGCCYLGDLSDAKLFDAIMLCVRAGHPVAFGGSTAIDSKADYGSGIKRGVIHGKWAHATAFIAYREFRGKEYLAHINSWGDTYGVGKIEREPGSVVWLESSDVRKMCIGQFRDAFVITYVESTPGQAQWGLAPMLIPFPAVHS